MVQARGQAAARTKRIAPVGAPKAQHGGWLVLGGCGRLSGHVGAGVGAGGCGTAPTEATTDPGEVAIGAGRGGACDPALGTWAGV